MKKILLATLLTVFSSIGVVSAVTIPSPVSGDFLSNFNRLTSLIRPIVSLTFLGVFLWGGFVRLKAGDSKDEVEKSSKIMTSAIIGLIIIFIAPSIVDFVGLIFGVEDLIDFNP